MMTTKLHSSALLALLVLAPLTGCGRKPAPVPPPALEVLVVTVTPRDVPVIKESVATLDGLINANISAQVQGYLISRDYVEGSVVRKGDLLFQIDPRPFQAALAQAKANRTKDKATQLKAEADRRRAMDLFTKQVISEQERDTFLAAAESSTANVEADEAAVQQAELNLGYTRVTAPIDGVAGLASAQVGDLVGPGSGVLTTVSQVDPIKAIVNTGEQSFTEFVSRHSDAAERDSYIEALHYELILANGSPFPQKGKFYAVDRQLDVKTGSIKVEVTFPNPGNILRPGQFGKLRVATETRKGALVVPQEAVTELQGNYQVAVIDQDNKAHIRTVKIGEHFGATWEVIEGLQPSEKIIAQGGQKTREGMPVKVKNWVPPAEATTSLTAAQTKEP